MLGSVPHLARVLGGSSPSSSGTTSSSRGSSRSIISSNSFISDCVVLKYFFQSQMLQSPLSHSGLGSTPWASHGSKSGSQPVKSPTAASTLVDAIIKGSNTCIGISGVLGAIQGNRLGFASSSQARSLWAAIPCCMRSLLPCGAFLSFSYSFSLTFNPAMFW